LQIAVIGGGAALVLAGQLTLGALIAFLMLSARVTAPFIQIAALIGEGQEAALAVRTLRPILDHPPERLPAVQVGRPALTGALALRDLRYAYPGSPSVALDGIRIDVPAGSLLGVVGRSGSGKTTLTRLLQGIDQPQGGAILFDGQDARGIDLGHLRRHVGIVLQETVLFRGTLRENILAARLGAPAASACRASRNSSIACPGALRPSWARAG
jgi:ATP-binding cassette, subfamily B, bacterial HlyB/CyaB